MVGSRWVNRRISVGQFQFESSRQLRRAAPVGVRLGQGEENEVCICSFRLLRVDTSILFYSLSYCDDYCEYVQSLFYLKGMSKIDFLRQKIIIFIQWGLREWYGQESQDSTLIVMFRNIVLEDQRKNHFHCLKIAVKLENGVERAFSSSGVGELSRCDTLINPKECIYILEKRLLPTTEMVFPR